MAWSEKLVHMAGATGAWAALSALCRIVLGEAYLFQWMVHNWRVPLVLWLAALIAGAAISRLRRGRGREETA